MEQNDMLSSLLSDPEKLQNMIAMASSFLGAPSEGAAVPPASMPAENAPHTGGPVPPSAFAGAFPPSSAMPRGGDYDPSAELMQRAMPVLNAFLRSSQTAVKQEKVHLLNALKPFVADGVSGQLDHAMRLVSMARMARSAMRQIGTQPSQGNQDDGTREV